MATGLKLKVRQKCPSTRNARSKNTIFTLINAFALINVLASFLKIIIGVGRFRILGGGQGLEYWRGQGGWGGANSQQAHDVVMTSMRSNDVASTSFRRHVPTRFF